MLRFKEKKVDFTNTKKYFLSIFRCTSYIYKTSIKSIRTYIYLFIVPLVFQLSLYTWSSYFGINNLRTPIMAGYTLAPAFFSIIFISSLLSDWRESIFLKQLVNMKLSRMQFLISFFIMVISYVLFVSIVNVLIMLGFEQLFINKSILNEFFRKQNHFSDWVLWVFNIFACTVLCYSLSILISGSIKSIFLIQTLNLVIVVLAVLGSDMFFDPNSSNSKGAWIYYIGYLIPQKYSVWTMFMSSSEVHIHSYNTEIITPYLDALNPFKKMWEPYFGIIVINIAFTTISNFTFKLSIKS